MLAQAGVVKCVSANGSVTYTDQPCEVIKGEKLVSAKDSEAVASLDAQSHAKEVGQMCINLATRRSQCNLPFYYQLQAVFRENCINPALQYQRDLAEQPQRRNRYRYDDRVQDVYKRYEQTPVQDLHCNTLQMETWNFVKQNFRKKISDQDARAIEYNVSAVPGTGRDAEQLRNGIRY